MAAQPSRARHAMQHTLYRRDISSSELPLPGQRRQFNAAPRAAAVRRTGGLRALGTTAWTSSRQPHSLTSTQSAQTSPTLTGASIVMKIELFTSTACVTAIADRNAQGVQRPSHLTHKISLHRREGTFRCCSTCPHNLQSLHTKFIARTPPSIIPLLTRSVPLPQITCFRRRRHFHHQRHRLHRRRQPRQQPPRPPPSQ